MVLPLIKLADQLDHRRGEKLGTRQARRVPVTFERDGTGVWELTFEPPDGVHVVGRRLGAKQQSHRDVDPRIAVVIAVEAAERLAKSVKAVQSRLGHASAAETLDIYSHLWPDAEESTRVAVDGVLGAGRVSSRVRSAPNTAG